MQALDRRRGLGLQNYSFRQRLHPQYADAVLDKHRDHFLGEAPVVGVEHVERHLRGVKRKPVRKARVQHLQVDVRVLVSGKADVADLAGFLGRDGRFERAARAEDPVGVAHADDLVELHEVNGVHLEPAQALINLFGRHVLHLAVELGHQENLLAVAILERLAHADFADAVVVVPAVVHEVDAVVDGSADDADALLLVTLHADVKTAETDEGDLFSAAPQRAVRHFARCRRKGALEDCGRNSRSRDPECEFSQKLPPALLSAAHGLTSFVSWSVRCQRHGFPLPWSGNHSTNFGARWEIPLNPPRGGGSGRDAVRATPRSRLFPRGFKRRGHGAEQPFVFLVLLLDRPSRNDKDDVAVAQGHNPDQHRAQVLGVHP